MRRLALNYRAPLLATLVMLGLLGCAREAGARCRVVDPPRLPVDLVGSVEGVPILRPATDPLLSPRPCDGEAPARSPVTTAPVEASTTRTIADPAPDPARPAAQLDDEARPLSREGRLERPPRRVIVG